MNVLKIIVFSEVLINLIISKTIATSANQDNISDTSMTYGLIASQNTNEESESEVYDSTEDSVTLLENNTSNQIVIYNVEYSDEFENENEVPSVFDLSSYNNTCTPHQQQNRSCFIHRNDTAEIEAELCLQFANIIHLAYVFSCYYNIPRYQLTNATYNYIENLTSFLQTHRHMQEYYFQSIRDVDKISRFVKMSDDHAEQTVKTYSLPHAPTTDFSIVPNDIPLLYEDHEIYINQFSKYIDQGVNLLKYAKENNLTNIFPYLYEILLRNIEKEQEYLHEDLLTFDKLEVLLKAFNDFKKAYRIFDVIVLGSAGFLFFVGIVLNVILLAVFIRFKETRTYTNSMLINLVVTDCISLIFNVLIYYVIDRYYYPYISCEVLQVLIAIRHISYLVSIYSVVIISFQRYRAVSSVFKSTTCKVGVKTQISLLIIGVWVFGIIFSLPNLAFVKFQENDCIYDLGKYTVIMMHFHFFMLCGLPLILVVIFSIMASYKLRKSIDNLPGERIGLQIRIKQRRLSSRVLLGLVILSLIGYVPQNVANYFSYFVEFEQGFDLFKPPGVDKYVTAITYNLVYLNSCFNPLIIYFLSTKLRKHIHEIICIRKPQQVSKGTSITTPL
ncbi:hypothetical protein L9F63_005974 [Diploptera punctata]|uniref:G-protein coupled receptors family 1 profile domain-containing protein n=1 Tax=Diploptera punctata TaxID=6984 RepID=A0AAD7ZBG9_DIPPU|nr:hypothetical protein L9F63_005974 [Diploptera punctata]